MKADKNHHSLSGWQDSIRAFVSGAGAGVMSKTLVAPMERLKTMIQVEQLRATTTKRTAFRIIADVWKEEGLLGFFKSNAANCLRIIPNKGILFMANNFYVGLLSTPGEKELAPFKKLIAGSLSGATLTSCIYPLEYTQALLASGGFNGIIECFRSTIRDEGIRGIYRGYVPTLLGIVPYTGTMFWSYGLLKTYFSKDGPLKDWQKILLGAFSGAFSQTISYPLDTIRKRIAVQGRIGEKKKVYNGTIDAFKKIYRAEGIRGFYGGVLVNAIRAAPSQAIQFVTYGYIMKALGGKDVVSG